MLSGRELHYLSFFSLPEVKWLLTNPKEVPLNINDTPTAPLFPKGRGEARSEHNRQPWPGQEIKVEHSYSLRGDREKRNSFIWSETQQWQGLWGWGTFLQDQKKMG